MTVVGRSPLRVTHVVFDFNGGGLETLVAELAARFVGTPTRVSLVTLSGRVGRLGEATRDRFDQFHVVRPVRGVSMLLPLGLARVIRQTRADVVHVHTGSWYKGALAARLAGVSRVVYTEHGREHDDPRFKQWLDRRAARFTTDVVAVSGRLARYMATDVGIDPAKIRTIHNGVDTTAFTPGAASVDYRSSLGIPPDSLVIGSVGRLESVKAYEHLLTAAAMIRTKLSRSFVVVVAGDGTQRAPLEEQARQLGISDMVRLPGWTDQPVRTHRLFDVFVLPSRSEGQSVSLMEAMACGAAPVVTDVGSNAEMLGPALKDYVVPADRPEALADALLRVLSPGAPLAAIRSEVRQRVVDLYSLDRMTEEYDRLYRGIR